MSVGKQPKFLECAAGVSGSYQWNIYKIWILNRSISVSVCFLLISTFIFYLFYYYNIGFIKFIKIILYNFFHVNKCKLLNQKNKKIILIFIWNEKVQVLGAPTRRQKFSEIGVKRNRRRRRAIFPFVNSHPPSSSCCRLN
jgi:hypothetical protein